MNLPPEVDTIIVPQPTTVNSVSQEAKVAEKSRQCPICHVYYKYGNSYWQHVRYVHASFLSQCVICEKSYKRTTMAKHHILHSHKIAWHLCSNYVRKVKKSDLTLRKEIKPDNEKRNTNLKYFKKKTLHLVSCFNCYNCPGSFTTINDLFEHVKSHRGKENFRYYDKSDDNENDYDDGHDDENGHDDGDDDINSHDDNDDDGDGDGDENSHDDRDDDDDDDNYDEGENENEDKDDNDENQNDVEEEIREEEEEEEKEQEAFKNDVSETEDKGHENGNVEDLNEIVNDVVVNATNTPCSNEYE